MGSRKLTSLLIIILLSLGLSTVFFQSAVHAAPHAPEASSGGYRLQLGTPVLTTTKQVNLDWAEPGQVLSYSIIISNSGTTTATNVTISDTIPADTTFNPASLQITPLSAGGTGGLQPVIATGITVANNSLVTVTYAVTVNYLLPGGTVISNTADVTSTQAITPAVETNLVTTTITNVAPIFNGGEFTLNEDTPISRTLYIEDKNGDVLTFTVTTAPLHGNANFINSLSSTFVYTPAQDYNGTDAFTATVTDSGGLTGTAMISLTIEPANDAPVIAPIAPQVVNEGQTVAVVATASDVDSTNLSMQINWQGLAYPSPSNSITFNWATNELDGPGLYTVTVTAMDDGTPVMTDTRIFTITVNEVNAAPVLDIIPEQTVDEGETLTFTATASDPADLPANTPLTYGLLNAPLGASINPGSGVFTWTPVEAYGPGVYTPTVIVTDTGSPVLTDSQIITITVNEVNTPPVLGLIADHTVDEEALLTFTVSATDADLPANTLGFSLLSPPAGASISHAGGVFTWTPTEAQGPGVHPVTFVVTDTGALSDTRTINITVTQIADVSIVKSAPSSAIAGSSSTYLYNLFLSNTGPSTATGVIVTDTLPAGVTFDKATALPDGTCSGPVAGVVRCNMGTLTTNTIKSVGILVTIDPDTIGQIENEASISSDLPDRNPGNNTNSASTTIQTLAALSVGKIASPNPATAGLPLTYTLTITNSGPSDALTVALTDTLPAGVQFVSAQTTGGTCNGTSTVVCRWTRLAALDTAQVTLRVTVDSDITGSLSNQATIGSATADSAAGDNSTAITTPVTTIADLVAGQSDSPDPVLRGSPLAYTVTITNNGPSDAANVVLTDTLPSTVNFNRTQPAGGTFISPNLVRINAGSLAQGDTRTFTIWVTPTVKGSIVNNVTVGSSTVDPDSGNNTASEGTVVATLSDLAISGSDFPDPVVAGQIITYTLTVTNNGPLSAANVVVTDQLPTAVGFLSASGCAESSGVVTCNVGTLANAAKATVTIVARVNSSASGSLVNEANVSSDEIDPNLADNTTIQNTAVSFLADLSLSKSNTPDLVIAGNNLTYAIVISNSGPSDAVNVVVTDPLPAGVSYVSATPDQGSCGQAAGTVTCNLGTVVDGEQVPVTVVVKVNSGQTAAINNSASVSSDTPDPQTGNNSDGSSAGVTFSADISLSIDTPADSVLAGNNFIYTLTVRNNGPSDAHGVVISGSLPAQTTFVSATGCAESGGAISCNVGPLAKGNSQQVWVEVNINEDVNGTVSFQASAAANEADPVSDNNSATETTSITQPQPDTYYIFLPAVLKQEPKTNLSVFNNNTGGNVTLTVIGTGVSCTVPNNSTQFCGSFSPGTYDVQVQSPCGNDTISKTYEQGPQTTKVSCRQ